MKMLAEYKTKVSKTIGKTAVRERQLGQPLRALLKLAK
jgi:hypothetical protein